MICVFPHDQEKNTTTLSSILVQETYFLAAKKRTEKELWKTECWKLGGSVISKLLLLKNNREGAVEVFAKCLDKTGDIAVHLPFFPEEYHTTLEAIDKKQSLPSAGQKRGSTQGGPANKRRRTE
jgi:hypothetical protein